MSTLRADTIQNTSGGAVTLTNQSAAKSYVHFNGGSVSGSVSIYESFGKSSITDNGIADYTVTATNAMNTTQYIVTTSANGNTACYAGLRNSSATASLTSTTESYFSSGGGSFDEANFVMSATHGDLA
jgi:hypothetical protein